METTTFGPGRRSGRRAFGGMLLLGMAVGLGWLVMTRPTAEVTFEELVAGADVVAPIASAAAPAASSAAEAPPDLAAIPGGTADWWSAVTASIAAEEYKFTVAEAGLQAPNRAQNFRSRYRETGVEIEPRERSAEEAPAWKLSWRTKAWGRPGAMTEVAAVGPEVDGAGKRVTYHYDGMSEWYENRKEGLEQGFTVEERPAGEGSLRIEGTFEGAARPVLREDGAIDLLDENDVAIVRYGELAVWDAAGEDLPASLAVVGSTVAILVEDDDAEYPLIVDPLMTTPFWIAS